MKVLVIEDNENLIELWKTFLEDKSEFEVDYVSKSFRKLLSDDYWKSKEYNVVLLDIALGENVTGYDILNKIRELDLPMKVIILSAHLHPAQNNFDETIKKADAFFMKPSDIYEILEELRGN